MPDPIAASGVKAAPVEWRWMNRLPKGMLTLVAGKPDQGKGLFAVHVAADVSKNGGKVLYSAAEDSHAHMTRPRLEAAGADLDNVLLWRFQLPENGRELGEIVVKEKIELIVLDPLASHLSHGISRHSDNVRKVLGPLTELIERTGTTVLIIEHALKRVPSSGHPLDAIGGSGSGVPAACRAAFVFGKDPDDPDRRILAAAKFNIGPLPPALAFEVDVDELEIGEVPMLVVDDELMAFDPMRLFAKTEGNKAGRPPDKRAAAAEWLTTYLADAGGPVKSSTIQEDAKQYGMAAKTLRRAADDMDVVKEPPGGGRNCSWDLPDDIKVMMGLMTEEEAQANATAKIKAATDALAEDAGSDNTGDVFEELVAQLEEGGSDDG